MKTLLLFFFLTCFPKDYTSQSIQKGFVALKAKNYNIAEKVFRNNQKKIPAASYFGLAKLYLTNDYRNSDSSYKFILLAEQKWSLLDQKLREKLSQFNFDSVAIKHLKLDVSEIFYLRCEKNNSALDFQKFIDNHNWSPKSTSATIKRDSLLFIEAKARGSWTDIFDFLNSYPNSHLKGLALVLIEDLQYAQTTNSGRIVEYELFINTFPNNRHVSAAENEIYFRSIPTESIDELKHFVRTYPNNLNVEKAWRKLYLKYNLEYDLNRLKSFSFEFPDFPFSSILNEDLIFYNTIFYIFSESGLFGYMNQNGAVLIPAIYDEVSEFHEGLAVVSLHGKSAIINKRNELISELKYDAITDFSGNRAFVKISNYFGLIDREAKIILHPKYADIFIVKEKLFCAKNEGLFSFYDEDGNLKSKQQFQDINFQLDGNIIVQLNDSIGLLNSNLDFTIKPIYESLKFIFDTVYSYTIFGKMGLISNTGKMLTPPIYDDISQYKAESENIIARLSNSMYYLNLDGTKFLPDAYEYFAKAFDIASFSSGKAVFFKKGKFGIIDLKGKVVLKPIYAGLRCFGKNILVSKAGKWSFIDTKGSFLQPFEFDEIEKFNELGFLVEKNDLLGFLNNYLKTILPQNFKVIKKFSSQHLLVSDGFKFGLYSISGDIIIPLLYDRIQIYNEDCISLLNGNEISYFFIGSSKYLKRE